MGKNAARSQDDHGTIAMRSAKNVNAVWSYLLKLKPRSYSALQELNALRRRCVQGKSQAPWYDLEYVMRAIAFLGLGQV